MSLCMTLSDLLSFCHLYPSCSSRMATSPFFKHVRHASTSGPLHWLSLCLDPRVDYSLFVLCSNVTFSERPALMGHPI